MLAPEVEVPLFVVLSAMGVGKEENVDVVERFTEVLWLRTGVLVVFDVGEVTYLMLDGGFRL